MATSSSPRLSLPIVAAFGSTAAPIAAIGLVMGVFLPHFLTSYIGLSLGAVGAAFGIVRVLDLSVDPLLGMAMDRTRLKFGRYKPWVILGTPIVMAGVAALFMAQPGMTIAYLIGWLLVLYLGISILTLSQAAWGAALATDYHDRSRVYGVIQALGVLGSVIIVLTPLALAGKPAGAHGGIGAMGWMLVVALPLTVVLCAVLTPERVSKDVAHGEKVTFGDYWSLITRPEVLRLIFADFVIALGPGTVAALYLFFFHDARGYTTPQTSILLLVFIAAGLLGAMMWAQVARIIGKHRALIATTIAFGGAQTLLMLVPPANMALCIPTMALVGFVAAGFVPLVRAMVADVADEVRLETGKERTGLLYALVTTTQKIGGAITVTVSYGVLQLVGYNPAEGAVNTPEAIRGLELCYIFAPIILVFAGGAAFIGWKLDAKRHAEVRRQLDIRDGLAGDAGLLSTVSGIELADSSRPG